MSAPTIPTATDTGHDADVLRAEIAREAALGSDGQVSALSLALRLVRLDVEVATEADYPGWTPEGGSK